MRRAATRRSAICALLALVTSSVPACLPAVAAEFCVVCGEPDGIYRCIAAEVSAASRDTGAQLQCIQEIARRAGHKTCTIQRTADSACSGPEWVLGSAGVGGMAVTLPKGGGLGASRSDTPTVTPGVAPEGATAPQGARSVGDGTVRGAQSAPGVPSRELRGSVQTFYPAASGSAAKSGDRPEAVDEAANTNPRQGNPDEASPSTLDKAGKAVGGAAKKTWDCVSSLFSRC